ncbi:MAG: type II toxin-antitoxin system VapC family toxin [Paracoccaceae bacterium]
MSVVLDTSAVLVVIFGEPGGATVAGRLASGAIGTVNLAEVATKLAEAGYTDEDLDATLAGLEALRVPFDERLAAATGRLRRETRHLGLSLGDCACLALAQSLGAPILTADRTWADLDLGVEIEVIR